MVNGFHLVNAVNLTAMTPPVKRSASGPRPTGRHHGDLRNELEKAALALVAERGPHGFTLAEASRRAGVSVAAPYKHFADREALLASLARRSYEQQHARFSAAVDGAAAGRTGTDPADAGDACAADPAADLAAEQLAAFAAAYVRFAAEERALFEITFGAGLDKSADPELAAAGERVLAVLMPVATAVAPERENAYDLVLRVASAAHGLALFLVQGLFGVAPDALADTERRAARTARAIVGDAAGSR